MVYCRPFLAPGNTQRVTHIVRHQEEGIAPVMTSRERVLRAVNFQAADRVPIDLGGMKASTIAVKAYNSVKARLGIHSKTRIWDPRFMIASVEEAAMRRFHLDVVPLDVSSAVYDVRPDSEWRPITLYEGAEGLLPPGANIGVDSEGRWALLDQNQDLQATLRYLRSCLLPSRHGKLSKKTLCPLLFPLSSSQAGMQIHLLYLLDSWPFLYHLARLLY